MCKCYTCVHQSDLAIIEQCGKFSRVAAPGCHCLVPCRDRAKPVSLRLQCLKFVITSKTKDNMFVSCDISVNLQVIAEAVVNAFYSLESSNQVIEAYLQHSIRSKLALYTMEDLYIERNTIASQCKEELDHIMERYGFDVVSLLILQVSPDKQILLAINDIQVRKYKKMAAQDEADARKIRLIASAEAYAEASKLAGEGLAAQRKAIVNGLQRAVEDFQQEVGDNVSSEDVMTVLLINQYYDCLREVGGAAQPTIVLSHGGGLQDIANDMENGVIHGKKKS
jgi:regulator of protease activity HflC (stomatin/prohibitin superfamily)